MRRTERVTALTGAMLVAATAAAVVGVLATSGSPASASSVGDDEPIPADLMWMWVDDCGGSGWWASERTGTVSQDDAGILHIELLDQRGATLDDPAARVLHERMNDCLATRPVQSVRAGAAMWRSRNAAERLLLFDVYARFVAPCLSGHGLEPPRPDVAEYLDAERSAWGEIYHWIGYLPDGTTRPLDDILTARRACGAPSDVLGSAETGP